jgi:hypothetical protein
MKTLFMTSGKDMRYQHGRGLMGDRQDPERDPSTIFQLAILVDF